MCSTLSHSVARSLLTIRLLTRLSSLPSAYLLAPTLPPKGEPREVRSWEESTVFTPREEKYTARADMFVMLLYQYCMCCGHSMLMRCVLTLGYHVQDTLALKAVPDPCKQQK